MIFDLLVESFKQNSSKEAFCIKDTFYSYEELRTTAFSIATLILKVTNGYKKHVGIICNDDFSTYASLFGIMFSGCSYIPLGIQNPTERNLVILKEAEVEIIISTSQLDEQKYNGFTIFNPGKIESTISEFVLPNISASDTAYILFTSGSTGQPKGVPISHLNLYSFVENFCASPFQIESSDRCLQMFELTFDVSISSYLIPIIKGACVFTVPNTVIKYKYIFQLLSRYQLTSLQIVPSIIKLIKPFLSRLSYPSVKNCILTGEATFIDLLEPWQNCIPNAMIYDYYGPTETTIYCSYYKYDPTNVKSYNGLLAIGKAFKGLQLIVVDAMNKKVSNNIKGELLISGKQLTSGYLNNEEKNKNSFIELDGIVYYRSGDMCYIDENGDIHYCGRFDNQVKIQGFRIELSEIEVTVRERYNLNNIVIVKANKDGLVELMLVIEGKSNDDEQEILNYLKGRLPVYMLPSIIKTIDEFPLNASGKTDKYKIKELCYAANG